MTITAPESTRTLLELDGTEQARAVAASTAAWVAPLVPATTFAAAEASEALEQLVDEIGDSGRRARELEQARAHATITERRRRMARARHRDALRDADGATAVPLAPLAVRPDATLEVDYSASDDGDRILVTAYRGGYGRAIVALPASALPGVGPWSQIDAEFSLDALEWLGDDVDDLARVELPSPAELLAALTPHLPAILEVCGLDAAAA